MHVYQSTWNLRRPYCNLLIIMHHLNHTGKIGPGTSVIRVIWTFHLCGMLASVCAELIRFGMFGLIAEVLLYSYVNCFLYI